MSETYSIAHIRNITVAPQGLVAAWVTKTGVLTRPVIALGVEESWCSQRWESAMFDPDDDTEYDNTIVSITTDGDGCLLAANADMNYVGTFLEDELTESRQLELVVTFRAEEERRRARSTN